MSTKLGRFLFKIFNKDYCKRQSTPIIGLGRTRGYQEAEATRFQDNRYMKVVRLSTLCFVRLYPSGKIPGTHFC